MLWEPVAGGDRALQPDRATVRWLEAERGLDASTTTPRCGAGRSTTRGLLGLDLGLLRRARRRRPGDGARRATRCPARRGFPGAAAQLRRARLPRPRRREIAVRHASERGELGEISWGELRGRGRRRRRRAARARGRARRPRRRLPAELPEAPDRAFSPPRRSAPSGRRCSPDFGVRRVVDRFAQIEPKVLLRRRRLPLRRHATSTASTSSPSSSARCRRLEHTVRDPVPRPRRPTSRRLARRRSRWRRRSRARRGRRARLRARALRPPALGPLLLRHDRAAEGDRPGPRRDPARAAEEAQPAPRRAARRPRLLVHDDRLDDVELPRRRSAHQGLDRPLRRQPRPSGHGRALGSRRRGRGHLLRHLRLLHRRLHEGVGRAGQRPRPRGAAGGRLNRLAAGAGGLSSGSTTTSAPTPGSSRPRAGPTSAPRSSAACRSCPSIAASFRAARWAARSRPGTRTARR